jgi:hypothetical protein
MVSARVWRASKAPLAGFRLKWQYVVTRLFAQPSSAIRSPFAFVQMLT